VVPGVKPVIELVKLPAPLPSVVLLSAVVGLGAVLQQTPRAVTEVLPSDVTFPPQVAVVSVILDTASVVTVAAGFVYLMAELPFTTVGGTLQAV